MSKCKFIFDDTTTIQNVTETAMAQYSQTKTPQKPSREVPDTSQGK